MELYLSRNGQQVGPYSEDQIVSMVASGEIGRDEAVWHEGAPDWQPVHTVVRLPAPAVPPPPSPHAPTPQVPPVEVKKQGALIGGWLCFGLGVAAMVASLFLIFLYVPLFIGAVALSIVAMVQRRVVGGVVLLVLTVLVSSALAIVLVTTRVTKFAEDFTVVVEEAQRESDLAELEELRERRAQVVRKLEALNSFQIVDSSFTHEQGAAGTREAVVSLTIRNATGFSVKQAYFRVVLSSPERSIPWIDDGFSHRIAEGVEPGEQVTWNLRPSSEWGGIDVPEDVQFTVTVIRLDGADGQELFGNAVFEETDQMRLEELEQKYESEEPAATDTETPGR